MQSQLARTQNWNDGVVRSFGEVTNVSAMQQPRSFIYLQQRSCDRCLATITVFFWLRLFLVDISGQIWISCDSVALCPTPWSSSQMFDSLSMRGSFSWWPWKPPWSLSVQQNIRSVFLELMHTMGHVMVTFDSLRCANLTG